MTLFAQMSYYHFSSILRFVQLVFLDVRLGREGNGKVIHR